MAFLIMEDAATKSRRLTNQLRAQARADRAASLTSTWVGLFVKAVLATWAANEVF